MEFEPVLMVWDYYDGPRTGVAEYHGREHYFKCVWDQANNNYSNSFNLSPIETSFLKLAKRHWAIWREWEVRFHSGQAPQETHPGNRGMNPEYDDLEDQLEDIIKNLTRLPRMFNADFRAIPNQDDLPKYVMRNLEARWTVID